MVYLQIEEILFEKEENYLLLTLEAQGFAGLVKMSVSQPPTLLTSAVLFCFL